MVKIKLLLKINFLYSTHNLTNVGVSFPWLANNVFRSNSFILNIFCSETYIPTDIKHIELDSAFSYQRKITYWLTFVGREDAKNPIKSAYFTVRVFLLQVCEINLVFFWLWQMLIV